MTNSTFMMKMTTLYLSVKASFYVYNNRDEEVAFIRQELLTFLPKFSIERNGIEEAVVKKRFTLFTPEYDVMGYGWSVTGDVFGHEYSIYDMCGNEIATVSKAWLSWGDFYEIDYSDHADPSRVLCVVLIIDAIKAASNAAAN